ncbi:MAG: hypothetical protein ACT4QD_19480 [Acidobacteriota bacterium]
MPVGCDGAWKVLVADLNQLGRGQRRWQRGIAAWRRVRRRELVEHLACRHDARRLADQHERARPVGLEGPAYSQWERRRVGRGALTDLTERELPLLQLVLEILRNQRHTAIKALADLLIGLCTLREPRPYADKREHQTGQQNGDGKHDPEIACQPQRPACMPSREHRQERISKGPPSPPKAATRDA